MIRWSTRTGFRRPFLRTCSSTFLRSIDGLERVEIVRPGYAVEYEFVDSRRLNGTLEVRELLGLFLAGQINGTTGYEEAAAQGLVAGLNASARALDLKEVRFDRRSSYIGVMVDDLTLQGVTEPYRMMTARAEFRLSLRADNATTRLGEAAFAAGCLSELRTRYIKEHFESGAATLVGHGRRASRSALCAVCCPPGARVGSRAARLSRVASGRVRLWVDPWVSTEMVERLTTSRPETLDQAARVPGSLLRPSQRFMLRRIAAWRRDNGSNRPRAGLFHVKHSRRSRVHTQLLAAENERQNLVSASNYGRPLGASRTRFSSIGSFRARTGASWIDIGSGAGLPGIVIACIVDGPVTLVEPRRLRANFLERAVRNSG